jgi:hypothetical protein
MAWERNRPEISARWLNVFADDYVRHLDLALERVESSGSGY